MAEEAGREVSRRDDTPACRVCEIEEQRAAFHRARARRDDWLRHHEPTPPPLRLQVAALLGAFAVFLAAAEMTDRVGAMLLIVSTFLAVSIRYVPEIIRDAREIAAREAKALTDAAALEAKTARVTARQYGLWWPEEDGTMSIGDVHLTNLDDLNRLGESMLLHNRANVTAAADRTMPTPTRGSTRLGFRHCRRCDRDLPVTQFYRSKKTGRVEGGCKDCRRAAARAYGQAKRDAS